MNRLFIGPRSALNLINGGTLIAGGLVAASLHSPQAFERTGAVIVAITGLFVVTQIYDEVRMERLLAELGEIDASPGLDLPAVPSLAARMQHNADMRRTSAVRRARLTLAIFIALWLSVGEIIHGFGDIAFEAVYPSMRAGRAASNSPPPAPAADQTRP